MAGLNKYRIDKNLHYDNKYWDTFESDLDESDDYSKVASKYDSYKTTEFVGTQGNSSDDATLKKFVATSISIVSLIAENLLSHPFVVLRRQCQVHNNSKCFHIFPTTLVPVICHLHAHQGLAMLWKGLGSTLILRGMTLGVEDVISKITPWPKEISRNSSVKSFFEHIILKSVTLTVIMPYYTASLVETVQSDVASEKPGLLDVFREGTLRLFNFTGNSKGRMLPIWMLTLPTITLGISRYLFSLMVKGVSVRLMQSQQNEKQTNAGALPKNIEKIGLLHDIELNASLIAIIASDIVFYPFETILHRLYLQGTRTIIDNLDTGKSVLAILTNYSSPLDCYETCMRTEGVLGLYKGFGALVLQYAAHIFVVRFTKFLLTEITILYKGQKPTLISTPSTTQSQIAVDRYLIP
ncbi:hypothetical protein FQA39_LY17890 [Lamprigera yunnana]|nr:hypothetical protein FQA39_LY17890 [Lamprigera yunnana]